MKNMDNIYANMGFEGIDKDLYVLYMILYDNIIERPLTDKFDGADQRSVGLSMICPTVYRKKICGGATAPKFKIFLDSYTIV